MYRQIMTNILHSYNPGILSKQIAMIHIPLRLSSSEGVKEFIITRVCSDSDGRTRFKEFRIELLSSGPIGSLSKLIPTKGVMFRSTPGSYDYSWHVAPRRQFVVNLDAALEIEVSSGGKRIIPPGGIFFLEDTEGDGHKSSAVDNKPRTSLFIPVPEDFQVN